MSEALKRPIPHLDEDNRDFWTGGEFGELRIRQCRDCHTFIHPPRPICNHCLSENLDSIVMEGTGVVDSYTANYQRWHPAFEPPYIIARVAVDGAPGVFLTTNIVGCSPEDVDIGDRVNVRFEKCEDIFLPLFEKV